MLVYIIDDEPKIRRGLAHIIASCRPEWPAPSVAASAEEALEDPAFRKAELLFLDIQLPGISGLELLSRLREEGRELQVVVISGYAEFSFAQQAIRMNVIAYLLKPIALDKVYEILSIAEERHREQLSRAAHSRALPEKTELEQDATVYVEAFLESVQNYSPSVQRAIGFIQSNYAGELDLSTVASHVHLHRNYLSDLFKRETGINLSGFIADYRIHLAKKMLLDGNARITTVARAVGYSDDHYFSRVFSKRVGVTPQKYRVMFSH